MSGQNSSSPRGSALTESTAHPASSPRGSSDLLAEAAVAGVCSGMLVGLGTGQTSWRAMEALAQRMRTERLDIDCVATSPATERKAAELALPVVPFAEIEVLDYTFDGADEVDGKLRMLKGSNGAFARQRLVAHASRRRVYLIGEHKLVAQLGTGSTLPICILPVALAFIRAELRNLGMSGVLRRNLDGEACCGEQGTLVLDVMMAGRDPEELAVLLDGVPGVVDHGLFLDEADEVMVENAQGQVRTLRRTP